MWSEVKEKTLSDIEDDPVDPSNLLVNVFSFGSTEDGRSGIDTSHLGKNYLQLDPHPVEAFRIRREEEFYPTLPALPQENLIDTNDNSPLKTSKLSFEAPKKKIVPFPPLFKQFQCHKVSAGSRHSLFLAISRGFAPEKEKIDELNLPQISSAVSTSSSTQQAKLKYNHTSEKTKKRKHRVYLTGLNQVGLCEEKGFLYPIRVCFNEKFLKSSHIESYISMEIDANFLKKCGYINSLHDLNPTSKENIEKLNEEKNKNNEKNIKKKRNLLNEMKELVEISITGKPKRYNKFELKQEEDSENIKLKEYNSKKKEKLSTLLLKNILLLNNDKDKYLLLNNVNEEIENLQDSYWSDSDDEDDPVDVVAGRGTSFILTRGGSVYSWGFAKYGVLGHGEILSANSTQASMNFTSTTSTLSNTNSLHQYDQKNGVINLAKSLYYPLPKKILSLNNKIIVQLAVGGYHCIAVSRYHEVFSWGRNNKGQCGIGIESEMVERPHPIHPLPFKQCIVTGNKKINGIGDGIIVINVACGFEHSMMLIRLKKRDTHDKANNTGFKRQNSTTNTTNLRPSTSSSSSSSANNNSLFDDDDDDETIVFCWGDDTYCQLGSGDPQARAKPQENRYLTHFTQKLYLKLIKVYAGGNSCFALTKQSLQLIAWGDNRWGQLGVGSQYTLRNPLIVPGLRGVVDFSSGLRHCVALVDESNEGILTQHSYENFLNKKFDENNNDSNSNNNTISTNNSNKRIKKTLPVTKISSEFNLYSWGLNNYGELGHGDTDVRTTPTLINSFQDIRFKVPTSSLVRLNSTYNIINAKKDNPKNNILDKSNNDLDDQILPITPSTVPNFYPLASSHMSSLVSCGDHHTIVITCPIPMRACEHPRLFPFFKLIQKAGGKIKNRDLVRRLKNKVLEYDMDPELLENPFQILPNQPGCDASTIYHSPFDPGLRYCLDTRQDKYDWRRKSMEICYESLNPFRPLKSICLSCARNCFKMINIRPYIRYRSNNEPCDCRLSGDCLCKWSKIRETFDNYADPLTGLLSLENLMTLLKALRSPIPVEPNDADDCISVTAISLSSLKKKIGNNINSNNETEKVKDDEEFNNNDDDEIKVIKPVPFEKWYRRFYDENEN